MDFYLQQGSVEDSYSMFRIDKKPEKLFKMGLTREYIVAAGHNTSATKIFSAFVRSDDISINVEKQAYSISMLFAETVGYSKVGYIVILLILYNVIYLDFMSNILNKLFMKKIRPSV